MAQQTDAEIQAGLEKPGAGLPFYQHLYLRFYIAPFVSARSNWDDNWKNFDGINAKIFEKIDNLSPAQLEKRVLVPPLAGIEDSSRYWSVAMTLEHLIIVGDDVKTAIIELSNGYARNRKADVAAYKPKGGKEGSAQLAEYKAFVAGLRRQLDPVREPALASKARYDHPWMGPFSARQWQWLLGAHTLVHYRQIREIVKGL